MHPVNIFAVIVAAIVTFALGGLWYSPVLFARPWIAATGKTKEELRQGGTPAMYIAAFLSALVSSYVLALVLAAAGTTVWWGGLLTGFLCWLGFAAATSHTHTLFAGRSMTLWMIDTGYSMVSFMLAGLLLVLWR